MFSPCLFFFSSYPIKNYMHNMSPSSLALFMQLTGIPLVTHCSPCLSDDAVWLDCEGMGEDEKGMWRRRTEPRASSFQLTSERLLAAPDL